MSLKFEKIIPTQNQIDELFFLLNNRKYSISHSSTPSKNEHSEFVSAHPYRVWYLVYKNKSLIGSVYLHIDNSIGLNCVDEISELQIKKILNLLTSEFQPLDPVPSVRIGKFFINIASSNIQLQEKLKSIGLIESQRSFIHDL